MYDGTATLKGEPIATYDEYGNEIITYAETDVFVTPRSVYASEFYAAAQLGIRPTLVLVLSNRADYDDQKLIEYEDKTYEIIRADWRAQGDSLALTLVERLGTDG